MKILISVILFSAPAFSFFGDYFYDAKISAAGNSCAASGSLFSFVCNPAAAGEQREIKSGVSYVNSNFTPAAQVKNSAVSFASVIPSRIKVYNMSYSFGYLSAYSGDYETKTMYLGAGSWRLKDYGGESLDAGINLKSLSLKGPKASETGLGADLGAVLRTEDLNLGISLINFKEPSFKENSVKPGKIIKLGAAKNKEDYSLYADLTKRSFPDNNYTISAGIERFFRTYEGSTVSALAGLGAGDNKSFISFGVGYEKMSYNLVYSLIASLNGPLTLTNGFSFVFRFGSSQEETEYQKLISREMKYRKDLMVSLDRNEQARIKLRQELEDTRKEIERLYEIIKDEKSKISQLEETKKKLDEMVKKNNQSREELRILEEKRRLERIKQIEENYSFDWKNYIKMKSSGASSAALKGYLQKLINQYQGQGVDISDAVLEMRQLSK